MNLFDIYHSKSEKPIISFEVFPPKGDGDEYKVKVDNLLAELDILKQFNPSLISVTYGAGGSTREKTFDLVLKIKECTGVEPMAHFTCVNFNKEEILSYVQKLENNDIKNILALRGDPPVGENKFVAPKDGFSHANELVHFIKENTDLSVAVAGYPEKHPEAISFAEDIKNLRNKIHEGADVVFTQLFFDNNLFFDFNYLVDTKIPIIPGIMIIQSLSQIDRIIKLSGTKIPDDFMKKLYQYQDDAESIKKIGIDYAIIQVRNLIENGVKGLHFYPLNKSYAVFEVLKNLKF